MDFKNFYWEVSFAPDTQKIANLSGKIGDTKSRGMYVTIIQKNEIITDLTGLSMRFYFKKPDDTRGIVAAVIDGNRFRIDFPNQIFAVPGVVNAELELCGSDGEIIADETFRILVHDRIGGDEIISEDERGILDQAFEFAEDILPRLELLDVELLEDCQERLITAEADIANLEETKADLTRNLRFWARPAHFAIQCTEGRMAFSWNNPDGRKWVFPEGTVTYSGNTPIRMSTAEKPDVIIPAGGGTVHLVSARWNGVYQLKDNETDARFVGDLADLPPLTYHLDLVNCSQVTGDLADLPPLTYYLDLGYCSRVTGNLAGLPPLTYYLSLYNCSQITGDLADLPPLTHTLSLGYCSQVTGNLADLPPLTYWLDLYNCSQITGDLADLPPLTYHLGLVNCSQVTGAYTSVSDTNVPTVTNLSNTGLSATDMDNTLIAYAACTKTGGTFTASGMTRTSASDAAVEHLTKPTAEGGLGWTIVGITKV